MDQKLRRSIPTRVLALSFIFLIILANVWITLSITGSAIHNWILYGFYVGVAVALVSGVCFLYLMILYHIRPPQDS